MAGMAGTVVDTDADIQGKLTGKDAQLLGRFKGDITLTGRLAIGEPSLGRFVTRL